MTCSFYSRQSPRTTPLTNRKRTTLTHPSSTAARSRGGGSRRRPRRARQPRRSHCWHQARRAPHGTAAGTRVPQRQRAQGDSDQCGLDGGAMADASRAGVRRHQGRSAHVHALGGAGAARVVRGRVLRARADVHAEHGDGRRDSGAPRWRGLGARGDARRGAREAIARCRRRGGAGGRRAARPGAGVRAWPAPHLALVRAQGQGGQAQRASTGPAAPRATAAAPSDAPRAHGAAPHHGLCQRRGAHRGAHAGGVGHGGARRALPCGRERQRRQLHSGCVVRACVCASARAPAEERADTRVRSSASL